MWSCGKHLKKSDFLFDKADLCGIIYKEQIGHPGDKRTSAGHCVNNPKERQTSNRLQFFC